VRSLKFPEGGNARSATRRKYDANRTALRFEAMRMQSQTKVAFGRGTAWLEILIALTIALPLSLLLLSAFRSGSSLVTKTSRYETGRANLSELAWRWQNEAASAWAIFLPPSDVLGFPNCAGAVCHEVDFFARDTSGNARFWAWRFDTASQILQRYTYSDANDPATTLSASGPPFAGLTSFAAHSLAASEVTNPALRAYTPKDVSLNLGFPGVNGGNALTVLDVENPAERIVREFLPATTPSGFDVVVGTFVPPAAPPQQ